MKKRIFFSLLAVSLVLLSGFFYEASAESSESNSLRTVQIEAEKGGYRLIDVDTLWRQYQDNLQNLFLVDTRQEWEYHAGYIKGATNFPMEPTWLARMTQRGALEQFLGPDKTKIIVFY